MECSTPGFPILHHLTELAQTHVHRIGDAIQPAHPLLSPSPPAFSLSQHQGLSHWVRSSHQVAKVLKLQLQHQSFQCPLVPLRGYFFLLWTFENILKANKHSLKASFILCDRMVELSTCAITASDSTAPKSTRKRGSWQPASRSPSS